MSTSGELVRGAVGVGAPLVATYLNVEAVAGVLSVSPATILAVSAGIIGVFAFSKGDEKRPELLKVAVGCLIFGCAFTTLTLEGLRLGLKWQYETQHVKAVGIVMGGMSRYIVPALIERIPKWFDALRIPFFSKSKGD